MSGIVSSAMSHMIWDIATSDLALVTVAAVMVACFLVSHVPVLRDLPSVKPYAIAAGLVAYIALADLSLCVGYRISEGHAKADRLKTELQWREKQLEQQKATADDAERIAREKEAEAEELKGKVSDYEAMLATKPAGACALDDADLDGLRSLSPGRAGKSVRANPPRLRSPRARRAAP
jgi:hypothetical protein